jgi:hypothetical protein
MAALRHPRKAEIQALRSVILEAHPGIREGVKWNAPSFRTTEYFATTNLRAKAGVGIILHLGARVRELRAGGLSIADPDGLLKWITRDRASVEFADVDAVRSKASAFQALLRDWIANV